MIVALPWPLVKRIFGHIRNFPLFNCSKIDVLNSLNCVNAV